MAKSLTLKVSLCAQTLVTLALLNASEPSIARAGNTGGATAYGVVLLSNQDRLVVARVTGPLASFGLRAGDQIVAVDGRRVTTERAFVARLTAGSRSATGADILVGRNGQTFHVNTRQNIAVAAAAKSPRVQAAPRVQTSATATGGGFLNPDNMVLTNDGRILHKDVAARLGLEGRPLSTVTFPSNR